MSSIDLPLSSDEAIRSAYRLMAMDEDAQVWSKFGRQEIDSLLSQIELPPRAKIVDVGCGSGRHALELALRGYRVAAFDFVPEWVERVTQLANENALSIEAAGGELKAHIEDARCLPALEGQDLVLCLYDVVGSSPDAADAQRIIDSLFRVCKPGGWVVVGCMNGMQMLRRLPADRIVYGEPAIESLPAVSAMQRCGEVFDFSRMAYDPASGVLYRHEQFLDGDRMLLDTIIQERRYLPTELRQFLVSAGFESVSLQSVRAGQWRFEGAFDPDAPEVLAIARKPETVPYSIPRLRPLSSGLLSRGYSLTVIPKREITLDHAAIVSRIFCSSFGMNPKTGKLHVLGPKRMFDRLGRCKFLCLASKGDQPVGYMFGTAYDHLLTKIAWLDSICIVKEFRRQGLATALLDAFARAVPKFEWLGATSPNPVTKLVLEKGRIGRIYGPGDPAPNDVLTMLPFIQRQCEDLRGCEIDPVLMLIKTRFSVELEAQEHAWSIAGTEQPPWWSTLANLPEDYESLLLIHRDSRHLIEQPQPT